jgi:hypothetical protein
MTRRRIVTRFLLPVVALAGMGVSSSLAADSPGEPKTIYPNPNTSSFCKNEKTLCRTDNTTLTYFRGTSLSSAARTRVDNMMNKVHSDTIFSVRMESPAVTTGSSETDFIFKRDAARMPKESTVGLALCDDPIENTVRCDQTYLYFRDADPSRPLICHESGHGVGLTRGEDSYDTISNGEDLLACMQDPQSEAAGYPFWGGHNKKWIAYIY